MPLPLSTVAMPSRMNADQPASGRAMYKRLYIYRVGATDRCALTAVKNEPRLPPVAAPDCWRFWMQISPPQEQHRRYGFDVQSAVQAVVASGYHLFTGSADLLRDRPLVPSTPTSVAEREDG
jgi:hypothetical protein